MDLQEIDLQDPNLGDVDDDEISLLSVENDLDAEGLNDDVGSDADVLELSDNQQDAIDGSVWQPGLNCGHYVSRNVPLQRQAKVLVANLVVNLERYMTRKDMQKLVQVLPARPSHSTCLKTKLAASLLGLSQSSVERAAAESKNFPRAPGPQMPDGLPDSNTSQEELCGNQRKSNWRCVRNLVPVLILQIQTRTCRTWSFSGPWTISLTSAFPTLLGAGLT